MARIAEEIRIEKPALTRQDELFPTGYSSSESPQVREERISKMQFHIKDELLYKAITYGDGLPSPAVQRAIVSFTVQKGPGYAMLVFFARQALGLYRLPYCEDRILSDWLFAQSREQVLEYAMTLSRERISAIVDEVQQLYGHTQAKLREAGVDNVTLVRRLYDGQPTSASTFEKQHLSVVKHACEMLGRDTIELDMDTLNSFTCEEGTYPDRQVELRLNIPARDVLYCTNLIATRDKDQPTRAAVETREWVIINRSASGTVKIPVSAVTVDPELSKLVLDMDERRASEILEKCEPVTLRGGVNMNHPTQFYGLHREPTWRTRLAMIWHALTTNKMS